MAGAYSGKAARKPGGGSANSSPTRCAREGRIPILRPIALRYIRLTIYLRYTQESAHARTPNPPAPAPSDLAPDRRRRPRHHPAHAPRALHRRHPGRLRLAAGPGSGARLAHAGRRGAASLHRPVLRPRRTEAGHRLRPARRQPRRPLGPRRQTGRHHRGPRSTRAHGCEPGGRLASLRRRRDLPARHLRHAREPAPRRARRRLPGGARRR